MLKALCVLELTFAVLKASSGEAQIFDGLLLETLCARGRDGTAILWIGKPFSDN